MADTGDSVGDARRLLAFPDPDRSPSGPGPSVPPKAVRVPGGARQGERLGPQFRALQSALDANRVQLSDTASSPTPEMVIVFDLAGTVEEFVGAIRRVRGLEFLTDFVESEVDGDEDFYLDGLAPDGDPGVPQTLYLVMTNADAVNQLVRLFDMWRQDEHVRLPTGLNPLKKVFALLRAVRPWSAQDRVRETGLIDHFRETVAAVGQMVSGTRVEIELWHRRDASQRSAAEAAVVAAVQRSGGTVLRTVAISPIGYHGILAELPYAAVERVLGDGLDSIELLTVNDVMFVSPVQPMAIPTLIARPGGGQSSKDVGELADARIALLDGLPLGQHVTLRDRLLVDDPDDLSDRYLGRSGSHGTAMASLIVHGDLSSPGMPIKSRLYVRPVLAPPAWPGDAAEMVPEGHILVDLVHRAFIRMFEGDGSEPPVAPTVRVVNFSIGDPSRVFVRRMSPLARLLDWLSHKYNVLVVVSAGNHDLEIRPEPGVVDDAEAWANELFAHQRHRRLYSPAESINAITIGAQQADGAEVTLPDTVFEPFDRHGPAPYSASGSGFRRAVKPDVLLPGGRSVLVRPLDGDEGPVIAANLDAIGPGVLVAATGLQGELDADAFTHGTSNAAALGTRALDQILDVLDQASESDPSFAFLQHKDKPVLAKTLLVHAARWGDAGEQLAQRLGLGGRDRRQHLAQLLGYGPVDSSRLASAERTRAVLVHAGWIANNERLQLKAPLPEGLSATTEWRRLTLTLGWLSPVNAASQRYRGVRLEATAAAQSLGVTRVEADANAVRRGTVQHEIFEGEKAVAFVKGDELVVAIECKEDAGVAPSRMVRYGLAVSIEVSPTVRTDLHEQVRLGLETRTQIATRERVRG